jgi:hypothetical protein
MIVVLVLLGLGIWYFYYGIECALNGALANRPQFLALPLFCFWEELSWVVPGGRKRKGQYIQRLTKGYNGVIVGKRKSWKIREIVEGNLYEDCGKDVLWGMDHFVLTHVVLPLLPLFIWELIHFL